MSEPVKLHQRTGLPLDANDWCEDDWLDLYRALEAVTRKIARRHRQPKPISNPKIATKPNELFSK